MLMTFDNELAQLVTDLKWADWTAMHTLAVVLDENSIVLSAQVITDDEADLLSRLEGIRADHWSIGDLFMDLLCGVAYGFSMARPDGSHRYVLAMLAAIRQAVIAQEE